ncbi:MAG: anti-sigma factor family protein [Kofleriaceae bacterium]
MDRDIGGITCSEVLARLDDVLEGDLDENDRTRIATHVAGCPECEKFGARYNEVVRALRESDVPPTVASSLDERLLRR